MHQDKIILLKHKLDIFLIISIIIYTITTSAIHYLLPLSILIFLFILYILIKFPEISFLLFLFAGVYKADPRLGFISKFLDLTLVFGMLTFLNVVYNILTKKIKFYIPSIKILIPYFIIVTICIISLIYTPAPIYGTNKLLRFVTITSLTLFLPIFVFQNKNAISRFFILLVVLGILMFLDLLAGGLSPGEINFASAFGSNYLAVSRVTSFGLIITLFYLLMNARKKIAFGLYLLLIPFLVFTMIVPGGRGPLVSIVVSISVIIIYGLCKTIYKLFTSFTIKLNKRIVFIVFIVIIIIGSTIVNYQEYFTTFYYRMEVLTEVGGSSVLERKERFIKAFQALTNYPTIFTGLGIGGFSVFYSRLDDKRSDYPHNIFLEIGSELGIFALVAFILIIYYSFNTVLSNIRKDNANKFLHLTLLALLIDMLVNSSISGDINDNRFLFTIMGMIYATKKIKS